MNKGGSAAALFYPHLTTYDILLSFYNKNTDLP